MEAGSTHYDTLGVTKAAQLAVIRGAYKALALSHHPDKTLRLPAEDRATRSALFRNIQEAFDVLSNPSSKIAYDRELERASRSTPYSHANPSTTSPRHSTVRATSPEEKRTLKAKIEQDIAYLREQRAKRDLEDAQMDIAGLKFMAQVYAEMAVLYDDDALGHGNLRAYCAVQMQVYLAKIEQREREHEPTSRPTTSTSYFTRTAAPLPKPAGTTSTAYNLRTATPLPKPGDSNSNTYNLRTVTPLPKPAGNPECTAYNLRTATPLARPASGATSTISNVRTASPHLAPSNPTATSSFATPTRVEEKARKEAAKQAQMDAKAAAVRAEKEKHQAKLEDRVRQEAARKVHTRAKAGAPVGRRRADPHAYTNHTSHQTTTRGNSPAKSSDKKPCSTCGAHHTSFAEFRKCIKERADPASDESFFQSV